jgi:hypothetical protein
VTKDRAAMVADLVAAGRTGGEVGKAARSLGYAGRALKDLSDDEVLTLFLAVWPPAPEPREPGADEDVPYVPDPKFP